MCHSKSKRAWRDAHVQTRQLHVTMNASAHGGARLLERGAAALKLGARAAADEVKQARAVARGKQQHTLCARAVAPRAAHLLVVALRGHACYSSIVCLITSVTIIYHGKLAYSCCFLLPSQLWVADKLWAGSCGSATCRAAGQQACSDCTRKWPIRKACLERLGHCVVDDKAHVRLVNALMTSPAHECRQAQSILHGSLMQRCLAT